MENQSSTQKHTAGKFSDLREKAEKILQTIDTKESAHSLHNIKEVIGDMNKYQIELEIQNEELRDTRNKLNVSRTYLNSLFNYAPVGYITLTKDGVIQEINETASQYLGQIKELIKGEQLYKFLAPDYLHLFQNAFQNAAVYGTHQRCEVQFPAKNNRILWVRLDMNRLELQKDSMIILCTLNDIAMEKEAEEILINSKKQLEQMVEERMSEIAEANDQLRIKIREKEIAQKQAEIATIAKSEFLSTVSHEIRTPLNGVMGMLQLLRASHLDEKQHEYVNDALNAGRTLLVILNDILDISRIEAGRMVIKEAEFELLRIIDTVFKAFREKAEKKGIDFRYEIDSSVPGILIGDTPRIRQILFNLVGNAVKFTINGKIRLEVSLLPMVPREEGYIYLYFSVSDTGIGISDDKLSYIFDPFTQGDGSYTRKFEGTGLGLAVVKRLVKMMKGTLAVETELGSGTAVHFTIRVREFKPLNVMKNFEISKDSELLTNGKHFEIILAEDNWINQIMVKRLLEKQGHRVLAVPSGKELLDVLQKEKFDLILMDIQMPEIDGIQATRMIRAGEIKSVDPNIPIIAITAYAMEEDREKFIEQGINGYTSKPVDIRDLKALIDKVMGVNVPDPLP